MTIPVVVEDREQLPEGREDLYVETDSGFVLDVEGVDSHPDVANLRTAYQREKEKRQEVARKRDELKARADLIPEDVEQETLTQVLDRLRQGEDPFQQQKDGPDPAKIKEQVEQQWRKEVEQRDAKLSERDQQIRQMVIDQHLSQALSKAKVTNPAYQKAAKKLLADQIQVAEGDDGLQATVETDMGPLTVEQYVQQWTAGDEGSAFVDQSVGSGARGAQSSGKGRKQLSRSQFEELGAGQRQEFIRNGGEITD